MMVARVEALLAQKTREAGEMNNLVFGKDTSFKINDDHLPLRLHEAVGFRKKTMWVRRVRNINGQDAVEKVGNIRI